MPFKGGTRIPSGRNYEGYSGGGTSKFCLGIISKGRVYIRYFHTL